MLTTPPIVIVPSTLLLCLKTGITLIEGIAVLFNWVLKFKLHIL